MMMKFGIILLSLAIGYTIHHSESDSSSEEGENSWENTTQRIVGGHEATIEEIPWQVSIANAGWHTCGGSILRKDYILTAAHCTRRLLDNMTVRVGSTYKDRGGFVYKPIAVFQHPKYNSSTFQFDVSILKLNDSIVYNSKAQPVTLAKPGDPDPKQGTFATVSGFGRVAQEDKRAPRKLRAVDIEIISKKSCRKRYQKFDDTMLCTLSPKGGKDSCAGDSGGPLTVEDVQIGIASWGIGCGSPGNPGVYTSVKRVSNFISSIVD